MPKYLAKIVTTPTVKNVFDVPRWGKKDIAKVLHKNYGPALTIPMLCPGEEGCSVVNECPFAIPPKGELCPIERKLTAEIFFAYASQLDVGPEDHADITLLWSLVRLTIQARRLDIHLQTEDILQDVVVGMDRRTGEPITNRGLHPAVDGQEKLLKRMTEVLGKMIATRRDRADVAKNFGRGRDPMSLMAQYITPKAIEGTIEGEFSEE